MSKTLYVSNLPLSATEDVLAGKFGNFGTVVSVKIDRDAGTGVAVAVHSSRCKRPPTLKRRSTG